MGSINCYVLFACCLLCAGQAYRTNTLVCGKYEEVKQCSNWCDDDRCPNLIKRTEPCISPAVCGPPRCQCIKGYKRDSSGACIPIKKCNTLVCGKYEEVKQCSNGCDDDRCPNLIKRTEPCISPAVCGPPRCQCMRGYKRDSSGACIPINKCTTLVCGKYEEVKQCSNRCDDDRCPNLIKRTGPCFSPAVCGPPRCQCIKGYKRGNCGTCIPTKKCNQPQCNRQNEVLSCVRACPPEKTCINRDIRYSCLLVYTPCQPKCVCQEGYFRNAIGECITGEQCDQCSGKNEYYSCGPACDNVCADLPTQNKTNCPILNIQCNRKCYCEDGYARDVEKNCVSIDKCPKVNQCADPNEEYLACKRSCPPDQCFSLVARFKCPEKPVCEAGCSCKPGFLREEEGSPCVPICDCSQMKNSPDCSKTVSE